MSYQRESTVLELSIPEGRLRLEVRGRLSPEARRAWALAILERIQDLPGISLEPGKGWLGPRALALLTGNLYDDRGLTLRQAPPSATEAQKIGFVFRMRRLKLGWSQSVLAQRLGIDRTYLCRLERGRHPVKKDLLEQIELLLTQEEENRGLSETSEPEPPCDPPRPGEIHIHAHLLKGEVGEVESTH